MSQATETNPIAELLERNRRFAEREYESPPPMPRLRTCVVTCPDPRVDPAHVLGAELGDVAVVRAAAGRVSPIVLQQLVFLAAVAAAEGQAGAGLELVLMQHTDCGITRLLADGQRDGLAALLGVAPDELDGLAVDDPHRAVKVDIDRLAANPLLPGSLSVSGLVYDVASGRATLVRRRAPLRAES